MRGHTPRIPSALATGASPVQYDRTRHNFMGPRNEPSSARGVPPREDASSSEMPSDSDSSEPSRQAGRVTPSDPTIRVPNTSAKAGHREPRTKDDSSKSGGVNQSNFRAPGKLA